MIRDMKLHNLRNSVAQRLVTDASVSWKYIRREPVTLHGVWKEIHRKGAPTLGSTDTTGLRTFLMQGFCAINKKNVRAALTLNFDESESAVIFN